MRGSVNVSSLMKFSRGPGMDTRVWLSYATVDAVEVVTGKNAGIYVDITCLPHGEEYTAWVASPYAGNSAGLYYPLKAQDTVLVAIPYGDSASGISIIGRFNSGSATPPDDFIKNGEPTDEIVLVAEAEVNIRYVVSGAGSIVLDPRGTGKVAIGGDPGSAGMEPMALGQSLQTRLDQMKIDFDNHIHTTPIYLAPVAPIPGPTLPPSTSVPPTLFPSGNVKADKGELK